MRRETRKIALSSMLAALAAAILWLGGLLPFSTYACPVFASLAVGAAAEECGRRYGWLCFLVSAVLTLLLSPDREAALLYAFVGCYPLLRAKFERLHPAALRVLAKLLFCAVCVAAVYALLIFLFRMEGVVREMTDTAPAILIASAAAGLLLFLLYDVLLGRLTALYQNRKRKGNV